MKFLKLNLIKNHTKLHYFENNIGGHAPETLNMSIKKTIM